MRIILAAAAVLALAAPAAAQHGTHAAGHALPAGWHGRVDRANQKLEDVRFMTMDSSFHVITGPHVILWNPAHAANARNTASATFRQTRAPERLEGFGLLVGRNLDQPDQDYLYFLIRHDGSYMVRHRAGTEVHTLAGWTPHDAIRRPTATEGASNLIAIESGAARVRFLVNGLEVFALDRPPTHGTDGVAGFRVGHNLDVHISGFRVQPGT